MRNSKLPISNDLVSGKIYVLLAHMYYHSINTGVKNSDRKLQKEEISKLVHILGECTLLAYNAKNQSALQYLRVTAQDPRWSTIREFLNSIRKIMEHSKDTSLEVLLASISSIAQDT